MQKILAKFSKVNNLFLLIIIIAFVLRIIALGSMPPSLNWDEVSHGYNAYSILKTSRDEWGEFLPSIFRAYGDYKLPVYIYTTAISVALFGLNAVSVRLPSMLAGVATIVIAYLLAKELFINTKDEHLKKKYKLVALASGILVAFEPWTFFLSRGAFEANFALFLATTGIYFLLKAIRSQAVYYITASSAFLGLSVWTYNSYRVFVPLFLLLTIYLFRKELSGVYKKQKKILFLPIVVLFVFLVPMFYQLFNEEGQARYGKVAILDEGAINEINLSRNNSRFAQPIAKILHNKVTKLQTRFVKNWASHYSADFLFFRGGSQFQFNVPGHGLIYPLNALFMLIGIFYFLKSRTKEGFLLLGWFYLGSVASSITREAPHTLRSVSMLVSPMILTSVGLTKSISWLSVKLKYRQVSSSSVLHLVYFLALMFSFINYLKVYFDEYRKDYSWSWQYGYEQIVDFTKKNYDKYDKIIITKKYGEPHEFFLFFWPWDPSAYQNDPNLVRFEQTGWYWVDAFDKFYFVNDWQVNEEGTSDFVFNLESENHAVCVNTSCLLITSPGNAPPGWQKLTKIGFLDGRPAFEIYEN